MRARLLMSSFVALPGAWAGWGSLRQRALYSNQVPVVCAPVY